MVLVSDDDDDDDDVQRACTQEHHACRAAARQGCHVQLGRKQCLAKAIKVVVGGRTVGRRSETKEAPTHLLYPP
jgi:hypothetical protein